VDYPHASKVKLVCDNLNTHVDCFSCMLLSRLMKLNAKARRLEIYHTRSNGSWLNVAEIELSILSKQCLELIRKENLKK
ncbi:MAG: IS630 family transposase, partial [Moorea sp. SIO3I7]|nr:IS630 family transposase [Moorena sp. SIO3I7]